MVRITVRPWSIVDGHFHLDNSAARLLRTSSGEVDSDARPHSGRAARFVARYCADVRAGPVSPTRAWRHQRYRHANGAAAEVLDNGNITMLAWTIYISFLGVPVLLLLPKGSVRAARSLALLTA